MKYYSDVTKKLYSSEEELVKAEKQVSEKEAKEKEIKAKRAERAKAVDAAFEEAKKANEKANKVLEDFIKDYGSYHTTIKANDNLDKLFIDYLTDWMVRI
jgi:predicted NBD/HSP70 family sugar kinase